MPPSTTSRRRLHLRRLLTERSLATQREIAAALGAAGFGVSQATVSRDLDAIGAIRGASDGGAYRLAPGGADGDAARSTLADVMRRFVEQIVASGNLAVVKTSVGAANAVAAHLDGAGLEGLVGTVAGDDTVLAVAAESVGGVRLAAILERTLEE